MSAQNKGGQQHVQSTWGQRPQTVLKYAVEVRFRNSAGNDRSQANARNSSSKIEPMTELC